MTIQQIEQLMWDADRAIDQQLYLEGKGYLEDALAVEPTYGRAHNDLGWLYMYHLVDAERAEMHLRLAMKYASNYKAPFIHMAHLLFDQDRLDECKSVLDSARHVPGVSKSFLYNEYGRLSEVQGNYRMAIEFYKNAIRWSVNDYEITTAKENIKRCKNKRWFFMF